jgi:hypothetical protein
VSVYLLLVAKRKFQNVVAVVAGVGIGGAYPVTPDTEGARDLNGFLTTDAVRSLLANTEEDSEERLEESKRSANINIQSQHDIHDNLVFGN